MAKVYNKHHGDAPADAVNIMRGTEWGNPFEIGKHGDRDEVCDKFEQTLREHRDCADIIQRIRKELRGKDLVCCCAPKRCHGDLLLRIANSQGNPFISGNAFPASKNYELISDGGMDPRDQPEHNPLHPARVKPLNQKTLEALPAVIEVVDDNIKYLNDTIAHSANSPTLYARSKDQQQKLIRGKEYLESLLAKKVPHG